MTSTTKRKALVVGFLSSVAAIKANKRPTFVVQKKPKNDFRNYFNDVCTQHKQKIDLKLPQSQKRLKETFITMKCSQKICTAYAWIESVLLFLQTFDFIANVVFFCHN